MTTTQQRQRSWIFRQSCLVQFALIFFGVIALLILITSFFFISTFVGSDDSDTDSNRNEQDSVPLAPATITQPPTDSIPTPELSIALTETVPQATELPATEPPTTATGPVSRTDVAALEAIYTKAAESLQQPGMVYHATIMTSSDAGPYSQEGMIERWADASQNVAREEIDATFTEASEASGVDVSRISVGDTYYSVYREPDQRTDTSPANTCYGANEAVSIVLGCPGFTEESTTSIEHGSYEGQSAIILMTTGETHDADNRWTFTSQLYLDADSHLPLAREIESSRDEGDAATEHLRETYEHGFIPRDSLPPDFFDVVALAEEQIDAAEVSYPIYWLGTAYDPDADLPPLTLDTTGPPSPADHPYDLILTYRTPSSAEDSGVAIQLWSAEAWHAEWDATVRSEWESQTCGVQQTIERPDGQATTFMGLGDIIVPPSPVDGIATPPPVTDCGDVAHTRYEAIVDLGDTVLFIYLYFPEGSPYQSQAGLEAIVRGIQPRS